MKSTREQLLTALLLGVIFVAVAAGAGYVLVLSPIQTSNRLAATLQGDVDKLQAEVGAVQADARRLGEVQRRSLPSDPVLAGREYAEMMSRLLDQAKAPKGYKITARSADNRSIPTLAPKKPAYSLVAFEIELKKTDLQTLSEFLKRYYQLNLSHQITSLTVKRSDDAGAAPGTGGGGFRGRGSRGSGTTEERKDLDVHLTTQAVIMDGAENRRTLLAVPTGFAAVGGWMGYHAVSLTPEAGRGLAGANPAPVLAPKPREYAMLANKDIFHGPLPPPPKSTGPIEAITTPKKDNIDKYIRLDGITLRSDGTASADVRDEVNNFRYPIETGPKGTKVEKFYFTPSGKKTPEREYTTPDLLTISDDWSATNRTFKLVWTDGHYLYLIDTKESASAVESGYERRPLLTLVGGLGVGTSRPPLYSWKIGRTLKEIEKLTRTESQNVLERAASGIVPANLTAAAGGE